MSKRRRATTRGRSGGAGRLLLRLCVVALTGMLLAGAALILHYRAYLDEPVLEEDKTRTVVIPEGASWPEVVDQLEGARLIERPTYFEYWARRRHLPARVRAGRYDFEGPMSLDDLGGALREGGRSEQTRITLKEGATIFHFADYLDDKGVVEREEFLSAARDPEALDEAGLTGDSFEGYLFPDTFQLDEDATADEIVERLHGRWEAVWMSLESQYKDSLEAVAAERGLDRHDLVTLASLVERETAVDEERPIIARVFLNRLDEEMRLQSDPTCIYSEDTYDEAPTPELCKDSLNRYSTYVRDGLPPGPVANPGRASLAAVVAPSDDAEASDYLYFVARRDGSQRHYFSQTFAEHKQAIQRYLR